MTGAAAPEGADERRAAAGVGPASVVGGRGRGGRRLPAGGERDGPWSWVSDVALAILAIGVGITEVSGDDGAPAGLIALTIAGGGALVLRRVAPLPVLAATLAAVVAFTVAGTEVGDPIEASGVSVLIALYTVASRLELRVSLAALAPTVAIVFALSLATADVENRETSALAGAIIASTLTVGIWGLGAYAQTRRRYRTELERRAADLEREREQLARIAVHEERASIARELHDIVAHSVSVMLIGVRGARDVLRSSPETADDTLARVETSGEQSLAELRRILVLLREAEHGAEARPQPSLADLDELVAGYRDAGLPVRLEVTGTRRPLPGGVELSVYRIVQEALTNVLKHAHPTRVTVTLSFRDSRLEVEVVDDGATAVGEDGTPGHGIVGMRERVALLGGELETGRRVGGGFRVAARLPLGGDAG
jgi:signal transduction histidine kinase